MAQQPPAGWMVDPEEPGMLRFWNGEEWTEHRTPRQEVPPTIKTELPSKPGWYQDPQRPGWSHYWDGAGWQRDYRPTVSAPEAPAAQWSLVKVFLVWWLAVTVALSLWSFMDVLDAPAIIAGDVLVVSLFGSALFGAVAAGVIVGLVALGRSRQSSTPTKKGNADGWYWKWSVPRIFLTWAVCAFAIGALIGAIDDRDAGTWLASASMFGLIAGAVAAGSAWNDRRRALKRQ